MATADHLDAAAKHPGELPLDVAAVVGRKADLSEKAHLLGQVVAAACGVEEDDVPLGVLRVYAAAWVRL